VQKSRYKRKSELRKKAIRNAREAASIRAILCPRDRMRFTPKLCFSKAPLEKQPELYNLTARIFLKNGTKYRIAVPH